MACTYTKGCGSQPHPDRDAESGSRVRVAGCALFKTERGRGAEGGSARGGVELDVPTIGGVYDGSRTVVIYLSGLGRPLRLKDGDLDSDRNWFRRAWTFQEVGRRCTIAGDMPDGPMHVQPIDGENYETALLTRFHKELHSLERNRAHIFAVLADMQKRVSTNPVDRVAGLAFPLHPRVIPAYHESETLEDAWTALVNEMAPSMRAAILLLYPGVGLGCKKWRPTWDQLMMEPLPKDVDYLYAIFSMTTRQMRTIFISRIALKRGMCGYSTRDLQKGVIDAESWLLKQRTGSCIHSKSTSPTISDT